MTPDSMRELAERIVDARKGSHQPTEWDYCPCCGYDGMWGDGRRETAVECVLEMLKDASK